jgi:hypothetical protein
VAAAAAEKDKGDEGEVPELEEDPEEEAYSVQSPAVDVLFTVTSTSELVADLPAESVTFALNVCEPFERELVSREKDQFTVPEAFANPPPSTDTCTELIAIVSEAVPVTEIVPEIVAPLAGDAMDTEGCGVRTRMERFLDVVFATASLTCTVNGKDPATEGVPEIVPALLSERPFGREPLRTLHV